MTGTSLLKRIAFLCASVVFATNVTAQSWTSVGPSPLVDSQSPTNVESGRVAAIAVDPTDSGHWLIGVGNGGVWESRDAGTSWVPITDTAPTLAIGAVAFAPSDPRTIFVGTGESDGGVGFEHAGVGILKSIDGGRTWALLASSSFARASVKRIRVHPASPNVVLAITSRGGFGRDSGEGAPSPPPFGVLASIDGGATWVRTLAGQATALEIDTSNFNNQYAAIGDQRLGVLNDSPGSAPNGVYRSTDSGRTWALVNGPWGTSVSTTSSTVGRIELALSPSNPNVLYAGIQVPPNGGPSGTGLLGLFRTDNAWAGTPTWIQIPTGVTGPGGYCGPTKCGYTNVLSVAPSDPNTLFAGGGEVGGGLWRCTNCGSSPAWATVNANRGHSDFHSMAWAGNRFIFGNDGGVWSTADLGGSHQNHNRTLVTAMFYGGALHATNPNFMLGGLRDFPLAARSNGNTWSFLPSLPPGFPAGREWGEAEVAISSSRPDTDWMAAWIFGTISRTTDGGRSGIPADGGLDKTGAAFVAPVRKCPSNDDIFLTGTNRMWRTNAFFSSAAPSWAPNGPPHPFPFPGGLTAPGTILSIEFASFDSTCNTYTYGNRGGQVQITTDGGVTWRDLDPGRTLPPRPVNWLAFDPTDANILYAALSSFDDAAPGKGGHVFKTTNAMAASPSWVNVSPPADVPHNVIAIDPRNRNLVYAGTDTGLWSSADGGASWQPQVGLPPASVYDIKINPTTGLTVVFTYGRGAYAMLGATAATAPSNLSSTVTGSTVTLTWRPPSSGAPITYVIEAGSSSGLADLAVFDTGSAATTIIVPNVPGGNYFVRTRARTATGTSSPSNEIIVSVGGSCAGAPSSPSGLAASVSGSSVTLMWQPPGGGCPATSYVIEAGSASGASNLAAFSTGSSATSFSTTGVPNGTYYVRVKTASSGGTSSASNEVTVTVSGGPLSGNTTLLSLSTPTPFGYGSSGADAPSHLTATASGSGVVLTWLAPGHGVPQRYAISGGTSPAAATLPVAVTPDATTSYTIPSLQPATYFFRVYGVLGDSVTPPSNDIEVMVSGSPIAPGPPTGAMVRIDGGNVTTSWTPPSGTASTGYAVEIGSAAGAADIATVTTAASSVTRRIDPGRYYVRARALNGGLVSAPSNEVSFLVGPGSCSSKPAPPTLLPVSGVANLATFSWLPRDNAAREYRLSIIGPDAAITLTTPNSATSVTASLRAGTYSVRATVVNDCGVSVESNRMTFSQR